MNAQRAREAERIERADRQLAGRKHQDHPGETRGGQRDRPAREPGGKQNAPKSRAAPINDWKSNLIISQDGTPKALLANAISALRNAPEWRGVLAFNEFTLDVVAMKSPPWPGASRGQAWTDHEDRMTTDWLQHRGIYVRVEQAGQAVQVAARDCPFHPVRQYLESLKWDGTKRIDTWLSLYLGVGPTDFVEAVGSRWLISAVARIFKPGTKADCCLILEGPQGIGKSRAIRTLAGEWFTDEIGEFGSKDAAMQTRGVWIIEIAELDSMNRSETSRIKSFMSRTADRFRPPYSRHLIESLRQSVFCGSVNHSMYLKDETGGRRFWPVLCTRILMTELQRDRDQLWAEAVVAFRNDRAWWLDSIELNRLADQEQIARFESDPWETRITEYLSNRDDTSVSEVLEQCIGKKPEQWVQADQQRVGKILVLRGFNRYRTGPKDGRVWRYRAPQLTLGL